jgi:acetolactate synthase-1/2/3 large subunit
VPVYLNGAGRGCLPFDHPNFFQGTRKDALSEADVIFVIGTPFDFRMGYGAPPGFSAEAKVVQVDGDATEIGRNRAVDVGIVGDARSVLEQLEAGAARRSADGWTKPLREKEAEKAERQAALEKSDQTPIHHFRLAKEMSDFFNDAGDPTWIADGGNFVVLAAKSIKLKGPGRWLDPGPLGCLGVGAPFAIAAKLLHPERPAVIIQGDGSFGLNGFDYETAVRFKLPMVCVVGNDAAWGQIRIPQVQFHGADKSPATLLAPTRYDRVMEAFGGHGENVTEPSQIRPALERALASGKPACVNVMLDPDAPLESGAMGYAV